MKRNYFSIKGIFLFAIIFSLTSSVIANDRQKVYKELDKRMKFLSALVQLKIELKKAKQKVLVLENTLSEKDKTIASLTDNLKSRTNELVQLESYILQKFLPELDNKMGNITPEKDDKIIETEEKKDKPMLKEINYFYHYNHTAVFKWESSKIYENNSPIITNMRLAFNF